MAWIQDVTYEIHRQKDLWESRQSFFIDSNHAQPTLACRAHAANSSYSNISEGLTLLPDDEDGPVPCPPPQHHYTRHERHPPDRWNTKFILPKVGSSVMHAWHTPKYQHLSSDWHLLLWSSWHLLLWSSRTSLIIQELFLIIQKILSSFINYSLSSRPSYNLYVIDKIPVFHKVSVLMLGSY